MSLFTFHHVSIKTSYDLLYKEPGTTFTFHHVSIKTFNIHQQRNIHPNSHSTMYLLKPQKPINHHINVINSHSTMYLLKLDPVTVRSVTFPHSHSTMYLLKLNTFKELSIKVYEFTFHHVSIKTIVSTWTPPLLLEFTFHHVSIKTKYQAIFTAIPIQIHIPPCIY